MQRADEKTTVPNPSAATGGEQSFFKEPDASIADFPLPDNEDFSDDFFRRINDPGFLPTYSMPELYGSIFHSKPPIIQNLLYPGTYLFAGAPKIGKSFLMAQLAFHISSGKPLWNFAVQQGTVLYLALEDNQERLQQRLYRMFGTDVAPALYFSNAAKPLGGGLDQQIETFRREHPDTNLVIIDTLQKVRESGNEKCSYASDYEMMASLKSFADESGVCKITLQRAQELTQHSAMRYDREGDEHYDIISAYQKSMRGSDPNAALHYLARLLEAGDLVSACRRLMVCACEDVGLAYPQIIPIVKPPLTRRICSDCPRRGYRSRMRLCLWRRARNQTPPTTG